MMKKQLTNELKVIVKKCMLLLCALIILGTVLGSQTNVYAITEVVTAKSGWKNTGNIEKSSTGAWISVTNYSGYGNLAKTKIRVRAKIGGEYVTVLTAREHNKDNQWTLYGLSNSVNQGKLMRFCYALPNSAGVSSDTCKIQYNLY